MVGRPSCGPRSPALRAEPGKRFMIDCRSLRISHVPIADDVDIVILDAGTRRV